MVHAKNYEKTSDQLILDARLFDAIREKNLSMANELLKMGADPNAKDEDGVSPVYKSELMESSEMLKFFIEKGADIKKGDDTYEALSHAILLKNMERVRILVEAGADINTGGRNGSSPLFEAVNAFYYDRNPEQGFAIAKYLISKGADLNALSGDGSDKKEALLCEAVCNDDIKLVKLLLDAGADVNARGHNDATPLIRAAEISSRIDVKKIIPMLIQHRADVNVRNRDGRTALTSLLCDSEANIDIIKLLISNKIDVQQRDIERAARKGNIDLFNIICSTATKIDYSKILCNAAKGGSTEIISLILKKESQNPNLKEELSPALYTAAKKGNIEAARLLIKKGADIHYRDSYNEDTAILIAAGEGHLELVELLADNGADVNKLNEYGSSALLEASGNGHASVVRYLLEKGAQINHFAAGRRKNPLLMACMRGHVEVVKILIDKNADLSVKDEDGKSPLELALKNRRYDIAVFLINKGANLENYDGDINSILSALVNTGDLKLIKDLIEKNKEFSKEGCIGLAIVAAADKGNVDILDFLLETSPAAGKRFGRMALIAVCKHYKGDISLSLMTKLLKFYKPDNDSSRNSLSPFMVAMANSSDKNADMAKMLLKYKSDVNTHTDNGTTPLIYAVKRHDPDLVQLLLDKGANVNFQLISTDWKKYREILGNNLFIGVTGGFRHPGRFFTAMKEAYKNCRNIGDTALHVAATGRHYGFGSEGHGNNTIVKLLLGYSARVDARDDYENTPLIYAASGKCFETVQSLLNAGADISARNKEGHNAILRAASIGNTSIVEFLIKNGASIDMEDGHDQYNDTALKLAVKEDHPDVVKLLLEHGADVGDAEEWVKSNEVKALLLKYKKGNVAELSETEKKLYQVMERERLKQKEKDLEEERKNRKTYPEDTHVYQFFDPFNEPMEGCQFNVEYDGKTEVKTTDKNGQIYFHNVRDKNSIKIDDSRFR